MKKEKKRIKIRLLEEISLLNKGQVVEANESDARDLVAEGNAEYEYDKFNNTKY